MARALEPGPVALLDPAIIPRPGPVDRGFETIASTTGARILAGEAALEREQRGLTEAGAEDPDRDFEELIRPAIGELEAQLGSLDEIDPGPAFHQALLALEEADRLAGELPAERSAIGELPIPGEGSNRFGETEWVERGEEGAPPPGGGEPPPEV